MKKCLLLETCMISHNYLYWRSTGIWPLGTENWEVEGEPPNSSSHVLNIVSMIDKCINYRY